MSREVAGTAPAPRRGGRPDPAAGGRNDPDDDPDRDGTPPDPPDSRRARVAARLSTPGRRAAAALLLPVLAAAGLAAAGGVPGAAPAPEPAPSRQGWGPGPDPTNPARPAGPVPASLLGATALLALDPAVPRSRLGLERIPVVVTLVNRRDEPLVVEQLAVTGLGSALLDLRRPVGAGPELSVPVKGMLTPDCRVQLGEPLARVTLTGRWGDGPRTTIAMPVRGDVRSVLDPLCPRLEPGFRIAVARTRVEGPGRFTVRLVNHGRRSGWVVPRLGPDAKGLRLTAVPDLPVGLYPGQARLVRIALDVPLCPAPQPAEAVRQVSLEAEMRDGFVEVTRWPTDLVRATLDAAARRCG